MFREDEGMHGSQMGCRMEELNIKKHDKEKKTVEWRKTWRKERGETAKAFFSSQRRKSHLQQFTAVAFA